MARTFRSISDPAQIRALAHPLRLELLEHLREVRQATATECAGHVGESVASCSFHLRMLEKYGFVERAPRRGREKPWRLVGDGGLDARPDRSVPGSLTAVRALASLALRREADRLGRFLARSDEEPDEWLSATTLTTAAFWATAEELDQLSRDVQALTDRFEGRAADPALRPPGARHSRLFAAVNPDPADEKGP